MTDTAQGEDPMIGEPVARMTLEQLGVRIKMFTIEAMDAGGFSESLQWTPGVDAAIAELARRDADAAPGEPWKSEYHELREAAKAVLTAGSDARIDELCRLERVVYSPSPVPVVGQRAGVVSDEQRWRLAQAFLLSYPEGDPYEITNVQAGRLAEIALAALGIEVEP